MDKKRKVGKVLLIIGLILLILQFFSLIGGGLDILSSISTTYDAVFAFGFFLPGILGFVLLGIAVVLGGKKNEEDEH